MNSGWRELLKKILCMHSTVLRPTSLFDRPPFHRGGVTSEKYTVYTQYIFFGERGPSADDREFQKKILCIHSIFCSGNARSVKGGARARARSSTSSDVTNSARYVGCGCDRQGLSDSWPLRGVGRDRHGLSGSWPLMSSDGTATRAIAGSRPRSQFRARATPPRRCS